MYVQILTEVLFGIICSPLTLIRRVRDNGRPARSDPKHSHIP